MKEMAEFELEPAHIRGNKENSLSALRWQESDNPSAFRLFGEYSTDPRHGTKMSGRH